MKYKSTARGQKRMISREKLFTIGHIAYIACTATLYLLVLNAVLPASLIIIPLLLCLVPISIDALEKLRNRIIGTELFLTIATVISLIGHQEQAMTAVLILMLIAEFIEHLVSERTNQEIKSLIDLIPQNALVKRDDQEIEIPIKAITPGTLVIIKTGSRIPVDGIIVQGTAAINESSLTGESIAHEKTVSQHVYAGTFAERGSITVRTEKVGEDTLFGKISALIQKTEEKKAKIAVLADKVAFYLVPGLLLLIGITWLVTHDLTLVTTLLVFGSPFELTIVTPLAVLAGIIAAFRNGILVKGGIVLETFSHTDTIIFDKTGTLTMGEPVVTQIDIFDPSYTQHEILTIAAIAEKRSDHLFAKAILKKAVQEGITTPDAQDYRSIPGHGVAITYNGMRCFLGNKHFMQAPEHGNIPIPEHRDNHSPDQASSFYVGCNGTLLGKISITDTIRPDAKQTINDLKKMGIQQFILLSGDTQQNTDAVAQALGIPTAYGTMFPDAKLNMIETLQKEGHRVAMVGDGINDAPGLKQANVGIAMGAMGMEPAIEAADIVLVTNDLHKVVFMFALSQQIFSVIKQNIIFGFLLIHGVGIMLAYCGSINPLQAALFHGISDIAILLNSARLINFRLPNIR
jgi:heavy metal translocating P-type ATPase